MPPVIDPNTEKPVLEKTMIYVPQGCYALIKPDTDPNVVGLWTHSIITCAGVILTNDNRSYTFLAHIDETSLLNNTEYGLPAWFNKMKKHFADKHGAIVDLSIQVHCSRDTTTSSNPGGNYRQKIDEALKKCDTGNTSVDITQHLDSKMCAVALREGAENTVINDKNTRLCDTIWYKRSNFITKKAREMMGDTARPIDGMGGPVTFQPVDVDEKLRGYGFDLEEELTEKSNELHDLQTMVLKQKHGDNHFSPLICCFDGETILDHKRTIQVYETKLGESVVQRTK